MKYEEQYLMHHGIKGQQWGVQNGPPYPLDSSISDGTKLTKKQQKANAKLANKDREKLISVIKKEKDLKNAIDEFNNTELKKFFDLGDDVYKKYDEPFYQYCKEKRLNFEDESDKYYDAHAKMLATAKKVTDEYLGKYGKDHMKNVSRDFNKETYLVKEITGFKYLRSSKDLYEILEWNEHHDSKI